MYLSIEPEIKKRIIVLLPESLAGNFNLARAVNQLARQHQAEVLYLTLMDDSNWSLTISRSMATMNAVTSDNSLLVRSKLVDSAAWLAALKGIFRPGDILVCNAEQTVRNSFLTTLPMGDFLLEKFPSAKVITLGGYYHPRREQVRLMMNHLLQWIGFLFILAAFSLLEINLDTAVHGAIHAIVLIMVIGVEFGAVLAWNNFTSK